MTYDAEISYHFIQFMSSVAVLLKLIRPTRQLLRTKVARHWLSFRRKVTHDVQKV